MRSIPFDEFRPSAKWCALAQKAQDSVLEIAKKIPNTPEKELPQLFKELKAEIAKHAGLWAALKREMADLSAGKCWYCESRENRSDLAVDHFRPKNEVNGCDAHHGYWWLAFEPSNYRFACNFCNSLHGNEKTGRSLGKGTYFPLLDESTRVFDPSGSLESEQAALLDPTEPLDPGLLGFLDDGTAVPRYSKDASALFNEKAVVSIDIYNLNDVRICEERRAIANEIKLQVARAEKYLNQAKNGEQAPLDHFKEAIRIIRKYTSAKAEFSSAARAVLAGYRDSDWVSSALVTG